MKKQLFLTAIFFLPFVFSSYAQTFMQGDISINAGVGFGILMKETSGVNTYSPPISVNAEYSITDHFGVGVYGGYLTRKYSNGGDFSRLNAVSYGARGTVHLTYFMNELFNAGILEEKLDIYGSFILGIEDIRFENEKVRIIGQQEGIKWVYGPVGGVRYLFNERIGMFVELGRGVHGTLTLGLSARL